MKLGQIVQDLVWQVSFRLSHAISDVFPGRSAFIDIDVAVASNPFLHLHCPETRLCSAPAVKPKKGDALLFFSLHVNATTDISSLHGSCPVIEGEKWSATKWIHVRSFDNPPDVRTDAPCSDDNELCRKWAAIGECYKNPTYMVGTKDTLGFCRKSCGLCDA